MNLSCKNSKKFTCNCKQGKLGKSSEPGKMFDTVVDSEGVCDYCGYYAFEVCEPRKFEGDIVSESEKRYYSDPLVLHLDYISL